jgi:hypothetical protein
MSYWNYRVAKKDNELAIYSIYYDDNGKILSYNLQPEIVTGDDLEEIETTLQLMMNATKKEIVNLD